MEPIDKQAAINLVKNGDYYMTWVDRAMLIEELKDLPSAESEYEPVTAEDFAKIMSENTFYGFDSWFNIASRLMKELGFVICKKTM